MSQPSSYQLALVGARAWDDPHVEKRLPPYIPPHEREAFKELTHFPYYTDYFKLDVDGPVHREIPHDVTDIQDMLFGRFKRRANNPDIMFANTQGHYPDDGKIPFDLAERTGHINGVGPYGAALPLAQRKELIGGGGILKKSVRGIDLNSL